MDNPFDSVVVEKKPKMKRKYKIDEMFEFFPEESYNTVLLKKEIAKRVNELYPDASQFEVFKVCHMLVTKYFYRLNYPNEEKIDEIINMIPEFEMFKTI